MKPEERENLERWMNRIDELDAGLEDYPIGVASHLACLFPVPETDSMNSEQTETVLEKWRTEAAAALVKGTVY